MTELDRERICYADFNALKRKDATARIADINDILVAHLASLYYETSKERIDYFLKDIDSILSKAKLTDIKKGQNIGILRIFELLWTADYDDGSDSKCGERLQLTLKHREEHEGIKFPTSGDLRPLAIFCRNFIYEISKLLSNKETRNFTIDDLEYIYKTLSFGVVHKFDKSLNLYW